MFPNEFYSTRQTKILWDEANTYILLLFENEYLVVNYFTIWIN